MRAIVLFLTLAGAVVVLSAQTTFNPQRPVQSLYHIEAQAAQHGWTSERHARAGDLYARMGDLTAAVPHWAAAGASRREELARALLRLERWPHALDTLQTMLDANPDDAWAHYQIGRILAPTDPNRAVTHLNAALRDPAFSSAAELVTTLLTHRADPLISLRVGQTALNNADWAHAERAFRHAAAIAAPHPPSLAYIGYVRQQQGEDAAPWFDRALSLDAEDATVQYLYGLYLRGDERFDASLEAFTEAVRLDPTNPAYYAELGMAHARVANYADAEHWLQQAVSMSDGAVAFREMLATFYAQSGNFMVNADPQAIRQAGSALPDDPDLLAGMGWALYNAGDLATGNAYLERALTLRPGHPPALHYRAQIAIEQGTFDVARNHLEALIRQGDDYSGWAVETLAALDEAAAP
jgi:tetratricopeptide (TPR) repeat protein